MQAILLVFNPRGFYIMAEFASKGVAGTGLGLGIAGTALGLMANSCNNGCGGGLLGNILGGGCGRNNCGNDLAAGLAFFESKESSSLREQVAQLTAEKYADSVGVQVYKEALAASNSNDARLNQTIKEAAQELVVTRERLARSEEQFNCLAAKVAENSGKISKLEDEACAARVREAQTLKDVECLAASVHQKIEALRAETGAAIALEGERRQNGDNSLMCYVQATYVPGKLVMPLSSLCPPAMPQFNSWTAPTNPSSGSTTGNSGTTNNGNAAAA